MREGRRQAGSSAGKSLGLLALGALAGLTLGLLVTDRLGGLDGLRRRLRGRAGHRLAPHTEEEYGRPDGLDEFSAHEFAEDWDDDRDAAGDQDEDEAEYAPAPRRHRVALAQASPLTGEELEARVLEVFRNDPELAECAIDISASDDGVVELAGWVTREADISKAITLARGVPAIHTVVSLLAVKPTGM